MFRLPPAVHSLLYGLIGLLTRLMRGQIIMLQKSVSELQKPVRLVPQGLSHVTVVRGALVNRTSGVQIIVTR